MGKEDAYRNAASPFGFENLEAYKAAREFRKRIFRLAKTLPPAERFCLTQQMKKAALSITNNIAEGHGRFNWQDNSRFCRISRGSLSEVVDDINTCQDEDYITPDQAGDLKRDAARVFRLLNGYISYLQSKQAAQAAGNRPPKNGFRPDQPVA